MSLRWKGYRLIVANSYQSGRKRGVVPFPADYRPIVRKQFGTARPVLVVLLFTKRSDLLYDGRNLLFNIALQSVLFRSEVDS